MADAKEIAICDLALYHVGYEDDQTHKNSRNIPLLQERLDQDPTHLYSWWHLGQSLLLAGDQNAAMDAWTRGTTVAVAREHQARCIEDSLSVLSLLKLKIKRGEPFDALLERALALYPTHLALRWINATCALDSGDLEAARPELEMLATIDPETFFDPQIAYEKVLFRYLAKEALALCYFRSGRYAEAARLYRSVAALHPNPGACKIKAQLAELRTARS